MLFCVGVRKALFPALAPITIVILSFVPPLAQDLEFHQFSDQRTLAGVPNFRNVVNHLPFLLLALWGLRGLDLPLEVGGTVFQQHLWQALRALPVGATASYPAIAGCIFDAL